MLLSIAKYVTLRNNGAREMEFWWFGGGDDGEDIGVGFVAMSDIFVTQSQFVAEVHRLTEHISFFKCNFSVTVH